MNKESVKKIVADFYLVYQPIVEVISTKKQEIYGYETLLRSKEANRFPQKEFQELIQTDANNQILLAWYVDNLKEVFAKHPDVIVSVNIHPQQMLWPSTQKFFDEMAPFCENLTIELTEQPPNLCICTGVQDYDLVAHLKKVAAMGYQIAIDDLGCGQNTLNLVTENIESITWMKFSLLPFLALDKEVGEMFLKAWLKLANKKKIRFIAEGIEDQHTMKELLDLGVVYQQGYYWSAGERLG